MLRVLILRIFHACLILNHVRKWGVGREGLCFFFYKVPLQLTITENYSIIRLCWDIRIIIINNIVGSTSIILIRADITQLRVYDELIIIIIIVIHRHHHHFNPSHSILLQAIPFHSVIISFHPLSPLLKVHLHRCRG